MIPKNVNSRRKMMNMAGMGLLAGSAATMFTNNDAQANPQSSTYFNVNDYDTGNDQTSIQAAIDAATANGGGVVFLPARTYSITSLRLKQNVTLLGEGVGTLLLQENVNQPVITTHDDNAYPVGVSSLRIKGVGGGSRSRGIFLGSRSSGNGFTKPDGQHIISQVYIEDMVGEGIYIRKDCRGSLVEGCWLKSCRRGMLISGSDSTISNCVSRSHRSQGFVITGGNTRFMNCKTFFNRAGGFYINGTRCTLVACEAQDNWSYGFRIGRSYATMNGCIADSNQNYGFFITAADGYLGGLNLTGITSIGRNAQQASKPWIGQRFGVYLRNTIFNDCSFTGIARDNNDSNYIVASSQLNNCVEQILNGRLAEF